jgi:hypothetical protein
MSGIKTNRACVKDMTEEEKKEHKRKQMREYMAKRKLQDPEFLEKQREYNRNRSKKREYNPENSAYHRDYYRKKRDELLSLKSRIEDLEKSQNTG